MVIEMDPRILIGPFEPNMAPKEIRRKCQNKLDQISARYATPTGVNRPVCTIPLYGPNFIRIRISCASQKRGYQLASYLKTIAKDL